MCTDVRVLVLATICAALLTAAASTTAAQATTQASRTIAGASLAGKDSFEAYCASCHGTDARGNGPAATALKNVPADLTALARRNAGTFPRERVAGVLMGTSATVAAHGTRSMPIWGPMFRLFESDAQTKERIDNLVSYLETLQVRSQDPRDTGRDLFRVYCAVCHGVDGRGGGPLASQLRGLPPDLTSYTARNGGAFPAERLRAIIDGGTIGAHGNREMPIWGDAFRGTREGRSDDAARARIDAIVSYLQSIQNRTF